MITTVWVVGGIHTLVLGIGLGQDVGMQSAFEGWKGKGTEQNATLSKCSSTNVWMDIALVEVGEWVGNNMVIIGDCGVRHLAAQRGGEVGIFVKKWAAFPLGVPPRQ